MHKTTNSSNDGFGPRVNADQAHIGSARIATPDRVYALHVGLIRHGRQVCHAQRPKLRQPKIFVRVSYHHGWYNNLIKLLCTDVAALKGSLA